MESRTPLVQGTFLFPITRIQARARMQLSSVTQIVLLLGHFRRAVPPFTDVVNISQSGAGLTNDIRLLSINYNNAPTSGNTYNNTIKGKVNNQSHASYYYPGYAQNTNDSIDITDLFQYNLATGASSTFSPNYERIHASWISNAWTLTTEAGGTGVSSRSMRIGPGGAANLFLYTNGGDYWQLNANGVFGAVTDAVTDLGETGHRPRNGLFSGTLTAPIHALTSNISWTSGAGVPSAGSCVAANGGSLYSRTDGTPTTTLYVCDNSTHVWTAK